jgi:hypothetical protein
MKRFLAALALSCVISGTALAGHIDTCGAPAPAPKPEITQGPGIAVTVIQTLLSLVV